MYTCTLTNSNLGEKAMYSNLEINSLIALYIEYSAKDQGQGLL